MNRWYLESKILESKIQGQIIDLAQVGIIDTNQPTNQVVIKDYNQLDNIVIKFVKLYNFNKLTMYCQKGYKL